MTKKVRYPTGYGFNSLLQRKDDGDRAKAAGLVNRLVARESTSLVPKASNTNTSHP